MRLKVRTFVIYGVFTALTRDRVHPYIYVDADALGLGSDIERRIFCGGSAN
jgi:hypothetical protein